LPPDRKGMREIAGRWPGGALQIIVTSHALIRSGACRPRRPDNRAAI
jgi:hypothetical protein